MKPSSKEEVNQSQLSDEVLKVVKGFVDYFESIENQLKEERGEEE